MEALIQVTGEGSSEPSLVSCNQEDGMACEDYPCCGHEPGDCPDAQGRFKCVCCGKRMRKNETSSICTTCRSNPRKMERFLEQDDY